MSADRQFGPKETNCLSTDSIRKHASDVPDIILDQDKLSGIFKSGYRGHPNLEAVDNLLDPIYAIDV